MRDEMRLRKPMWLWCSYCLRAEALEYDSHGPLLYPCSACHDSMEPLTPYELVERRYATAHTQSVPSVATGMEFLTLRAVKDACPGNMSATDLPDASPCDVPDEPSRDDSLSPAARIAATASLAATREGGSDALLRRAAQSTRAKDGAQPAGPAVSAAWCDVAEAATLLGCGRTQVFALIKAGKLHRVRDAPGRRRYLTRSSVTAYQDALSRVPATKSRPSRTGPTQPPQPVPDKQTMASELREQRRKLFR